MFSFVNSGSWKATKLKLRRFLEYFSPRSNPEQNLHRTAWHYFMRHYRVPFSGCTAMEYLVQLGTAGIMLACGIAGLPQLDALQGHLRHVLILGFLAVIAVVIFHSLYYLHNLSSQAHDFAEEAALNIEKETEIAAYFGEVYPWIFHES